jgi:mono/diheme cytochrome c family protein
MRLKPIALATLLVVIAVFAAPADQQAAGQNVSNAAESAAAFDRISAVFRHPRCSNCHTVTDFPRQGDDRHRHAMNVRRGSDGHGVAAQHCQACHQRANQVASGVPGADEDWHLAPLSMGWEGLSDSELCQHLLDPKRNGGRTGRKVLDHLGTNLVRWAWSPGVRRSGEARSIPPLDYDTFIREARHWIDLGAACPVP